jgi:hypothetical protein
MERAPDRPPPGLWRETLWSVGLIGAVVAVLLLVTELARI